MDFADRIFTDEDITLDGNTFTRCVFDGCVLRYNGGPVGIIGGFRWQNCGNIRFGPGVDPINNPISQFLMRNAAASGFRPATEAEVAANQAVTPKKDMG
jgi:hypothetical protein